MRSLPLCLMGCPPYSSGAGVGINPPLTQLLGKALAPALQIRFAGIQPFALGEWRCQHAGMDMRFVRIGMQNGAVAVSAAEFFFKEFTGRFANLVRGRSGRHRQNDVESFASWAHLCNRFSANLLLPFSGVG